MGSGKSGGVGSGEALLGGTVGSGVLVANIGGKFGVGDRGSSAVF